MIQARQPSQLFPASLLAKARQRNHRGFWDGGLASPYGSNRQKPAVRRLNAWTYLVRRVSLGQQRRLPSVGKPPETVGLPRGGRLAEQRLVKPRSSYGKALS